MNKHHPYNNIIERKLEQLSVVDADHLWNDMHTILDKKMPQKKEKRRFLFWLLNSQGPIVLAFVSMVTGSSIFFLYSKQSPNVTIKKMSNSLKAVKFNRDDIAQASERSKESITSVNESSQNDKENVSPAAPLGSSTENAKIYGFIASQTIKKSKEYVTGGQVKESVQITSKARSNFEVTLVDLKSINQNFSIAKDHNRKIDSLIRKANFAINNVKPNKKNNERGFYAGVMLGLDLSTVHLQSARSGSTKGFIIGYSFNDKWSIESGLLGDTKRVYDNGSSFNPPGYMPQNGITITAVNGKNRLYEWPVNVKYTFIPGKHNLFTSAGLSSYFMKSENYDYEYTQNNQPGGHNYLNYTNETKDWFSVANFSLGYTHKLGTAGALRVEPYLKVPIKNIGVGNMPIMSTGLNIGFTKKIR